MQPYYGAEELQGPNNLPIGSMYRTWLISAADELLELESYIKEVLHCQNPTLSVSHRLKVYPFSSSAAEKWKQYELHLAELPDQYAPLEELRNKALDAWTVSHWASPRSSWSSFHY